MKKTSPKRKAAPRIKLRSIYMGSELEVYEIERHAALSGAGSVSGLVRILNNQLKPRYKDKLTLLEQAIITETTQGNNELAGLHEELRQTFAKLKTETIRLALASLAHRGLLIEATRGGKAETARGAVARCWFPAGHKLASDFSISQPTRNNYGDDD